VVKIIHTWGKKLKWRSQWRIWYLICRFHKYLSVFKRESEHLPLWKPWDHMIKTKSEFQLQKSKAYALSPKEQEEVDDFINEQLRKDIYDHQNHHKPCQYFLFQKKDHKKRMCTDYHYLNDWTIKNAYPLPLISEIIDKVGKAKVFTKLDL